MYESQVRPAINGRKLVAQQPTHYYSDPTFHSTATHSSRSAGNLSHKFSVRLIPALLSAGLTLITGCGSLQYESVASANSIVLTDLSCGTQSLTGSQSKSCSLFLSAPALTTITVKLSATSAALKVPAQVTIAAGQNTVNFDAQTSGVSQTANVTITASYRGITKIAVLTLYPAGTGSGSQNFTQHKVQLNWSAPAASSVALAGFNVYRATVGVSSYARLNPSVDSATVYVDTNVQSGLTYDYVVKTVDASGLESSPSNATEIKIP